MRKLTAQEEKFAQGLASGLKQVEAYRQAYPKSKEWKRGALDTEASTKSRDPKILQRVSELIKPVIRKVEYDLEHAMAEVDRAIALATVTGQAGALVQAIALKSRLNGLMVEDRKNQRRPFEDLTDDQLRERIKERMAEAGITLQ